MSLACAITGLPYVGKTTLFDLLTGAHAPTGAFAGAEAAANVGVAHVPDPRLDRLAELWRPRKVTPAEITFRDLALPARAEERHGAGDSASAKRLAELRTADALVHVVRCFRDPSVPHVAGSVDPQRDLATLELELLVSDHALVERRLERLEPELRGAKGLEHETKQREKAVLERALTALAAETPLRDLDLDADELRIVRGFRFLTLMPQLVVGNLDEADVARAEAVVAPLRSGATRHRATSVVGVCAKLEAEIAELPADEAATFRADAGISEPALERVVRAMYELLRLVTFFTGGDEEARAWTVPRGTTAQHAAGAVHSDMERGFIRAEVIRWDDLLRVGSEAEAKKAGLVRTEGRAYPVQDGDTIRVLFNVAPR